MLPKKKDLRIDHKQIQNVWFTLLVDFTKNDAVYFIQPGIKRNINDVYKDFVYIAEQMKIEDVNLPHSLGKITKIEGLKYKSDYNF